MYRLTSILCLGLAIFFNSDAAPITQQLPLSTFQWTSNLPVKALSVRRPRVSERVLNLITHERQRANQTSGGLTLDPCGGETSCQTGRTCLPSSEGPGGQSCEAEGRCFCLPPTPEQCERSSECEDGEVCTRVFANPEPICASAAVAENEVFTEEVSPSRPLGNPTGGLGADFCSTDGDCQGDRTCVFSGLVSSFGPCRGREPCICLAENSACFNASECDGGEICAETPIEPIAGCISKEASINAPGVQEISDGPLSTGYTLDSCETNAECEGGRQCAFFNLPNVAVCDGNQPCVCLPPEDPACVNSSECDEGEVCADTNIVSGRICLSKAVADRFDSIVEFGSSGSPSEPDAALTPLPEDADEMVPESPTEDQDDSGPSTPGVQEGPNSPRESPSAGGSSESPEESGVVAEPSADETGTGGAKPKPSTAGSAEVTPEGVSPSESFETPSEQGAPGDGENLEASAEEGSPGNADETEPTPGSSRPGNGGAVEPSSTPSPEDVNVRPGPENPDDSSTEPITDTPLPSPENGASAPVPGAPRPNRPGSGNRPGNGNRPGRGNGGPGSNDRPRPGRPSRPGRPTPNTPSSSDDSEFGTGDTTGPPVDEEDTLPGNGSGDPTDDNNPSDESGENAGANNSQESSESAVGNGVSGPTSSEDPVDDDDSIGPDADQDSGVLLPGDEIPSGTDDAESSSPPFGEETETVGGEFTPAPGFPQVSSEGSEEDDVCIDSEALRHLGQKELVFLKHRWARVVCDASKSCATRGHMVMYEGETMMMGTYCEKVGCEERAMLVNSPKFKKGMRVNSKTSGLEFLALAARYGTKAEEKMISFAVKLGL